MQLAVSDPGLPCNTLAAALRLSHVSRRFRFIAHNTSELWTLVRPKFPLTSDQVQFWLDVLARSGERLIDVAINVQLDSMGVVGSYQTFLVEVIGHSDRWRKFEITSRTWEPIDDFLRRSQHLVLLPKLEELTIRRSEDPGRIPNEGLTPRLHNLLFSKDLVAPMLHTVRFGATYLDYSQMRSIVKDLVELHFENHTYPPTSDVPEMIIDLLRASPSLQTLTLANLNMKFTNQPEPVELPCLRRLEFSGYPDDAMYLLSLLRVPALEVLHLGEPGFVGNARPLAMPPRYVANETMRIMILFFTIPEIRGYWRASSLREISLGYGDCVPREVERLLRLASNVETFRVSCAEMLPVLVEKREILPNLRHLVVKSSTFCGPDLFSEILTLRPGVTLTVEGELTQDGKRLYNALKDTCNVVLRD
jgi:hypothetical protein